MDARYLTVALAFACASACTSDVDEPPVTAEPPDPAVEPKHVPASPELVAADSVCVALADGEALWSVSPEGHAWLAKAADGVQQLRVLDPFGVDAELVAEVTLGPLRQVKAWSQTDAALLTDDGLWRLDDLVRIEMDDPTAAGATSLCGDPGLNGMLLANGQLYERRDDQWWQWDSEAEGAAAPSTIVDLDGDCIGTDDITWLMSQDGTLWRLEPSEYLTPQQFDSGARAAATSGMLAVLETAQLSLGPDEWQTWVFDGAPATDLSASGGMLWLAAGEQLLRFDGDTFVEVSTNLAAPIERVVAHASGAWVVGDGSVCHVSTAPLLRIAGVRPYRRDIEVDYGIAVVASDDSLAINASIDGEPIDLVLDQETGWWVGNAHLDAVGWSDILLEADGVKRTIPLKRLPEVTRSWKADIEPIYLAHCTGGTCHGGSAEAPPDLDTYEAWLGLSAKLQDRVVDNNEMPPPPAQGPDWGDEQVTIIAEWLAGGMFP